MSDYLGMEDQMAADYANQKKDAAANNESRDVCETCDGDGYTEAWNDDQTDVVITLCTDCGPGPGDFDA